MTPYLAAEAGFSSVLSLTTDTLSPSAAATASRIGANWRHGPHQGAQKSTSTGFWDSNTVCWKAASVTVCIESLPPFTSKADLRYSSLWRCQTSTHTVESPGHGNRGTTISGRAADSKGRDHGTLVLSANEISDRRGLKGLRQFGDVSVVFVSVSYSQNVCIG